MRNLVLAALALGAAACSSPASHGPDASVPDAVAQASDASSESADAAAPGPDAGAPACDPHATSGAPHYTDATAAWGLGNVTGNRIVAVDLDGDGYPDLIIHAIDTNAREQIGVPPKRVWVLMNRPRPGGGRMFVDQTVESGVFAIPGSTTELRSAQIAVAGDVDNDGDLDLFSGTYVDTTAPDPGDRSTVLLNDGTGHFTAAPASAPGQLAQATTGATFLDADLDGTLDLFVGFWYQPNTEVGYQHELYRGQGDGTFASATDTAGLLLSGTGTPDSFARGQNPRPAYGVTSCDVDGDGAPDLLVSAYGRQWNLLYLNDGSGHFRENGRSSGYAGDADLDYHDNQMFLCWCADQPAEADCAGAAAPEMVCKACASACAADGAACASPADCCTTCVAGTCGGSCVAAGGQCASDNQCCSGNTCSGGLCGGACSPSGTPCSAAGDCCGGTICNATYSWSPGSDDQPWRLNGNTFTTVCADIDGDGKLDLYSAEIHHWWAGQSSDSSELLVSQSTPGHALFTRPGNAATGLSWPHPTLDWNEGGLMAAAADLDNDARTDLIVAASDYPDQFGLVFHQKPDGTFEEDGQAWGLHHPCMSGLAVADFDRDGDLDVVVGSGTARDCSKIWSSNEVHFYQSDASTRGSWLALRLVGNGQGANRSAIGARVTLTAGGVAQVKEVGGGYGHMAQQDDLVLFFGLGNCAQVDSIAVRWPDKAHTTETWSGVGARRLLELRQGDTEVHEVQLAGP